MKVDFKARNTRSDKMSSHNDKGVRQSRGNDNLKYLCT